MGCCPSMGASMTNVSLSTATGYQSVTESGPLPVRGTKATVGLLVTNVTGTATITATLELSYDAGSTFKSGGSTTMTAAGPKEFSVSSIDAAVCRLKLEISGTTVWCLMGAYLNWSTP